MSTQNQLKEAIEAAKAGDRVKARRLLQQIVLSEPRNERAWLWLASTSDTLDAKEKCLRRVLELNPSNATAREGLARIEGGARVATSGSVLGGGELFSRENLQTIAILGGAALSVIVVILVIINGVRTSVFTQPEDLRPAEIAAAMTATAAAQPTTTFTPSAVPTVTPAIIIVSPRADTLPPTFTPTDNPTATATPSPTATAIPLSNYTLLYTSRDPAEPAPALYRIRGDGEGETAIALTVDVLAVSPDGLRVAYPAPTSDQGEADDIPIGLGIYVAPVADPVNGRQLVSAPGAAFEDISALAWAPTGDRLAFIAENGRLLGTLRLEDGSSGDILLGSSSGFKRDLTWDVNGERLLFASDQDNPGFTEIYAYNFANGDVAALTDDIGSSYSPAMSPDGSRIVFVSDRGGDGDLYVMDADGTSPRLLTISDDGAEDMGAAWSADGQWIAFASNRNSETFQIYLVNLQGAVQQVTFNSRINRLPAFVAR